MRTPTGRNLTARRLLACLAMGCVAVTACGTQPETVASSDVVATAPTEPPAQTPEVTPETWAFIDAWYRAEVSGFLDAWWAAEVTTYFDALRAAPPWPSPPPRAAPAQQKPTQSVSSAPGGFLACVRQRESGGNYSAYNPSGAAGAYQVMPGTWNHYGGYASAGQAPPAVQDQFAQELYARSGRSPWAGGQYAC